MHAYEMGNLRLDRWSAAHGANARHKCQEDMLRMQAHGGLSQAKASWRVWKTQNGVYQTSFISIVPQRVKICQE